MPREKEALKLPALGKSSSAPNLHADAAELLEEEVHLEVGSYFGFGSVKPTSQRARWRPRRFDDSKLDDIVHDRFDRSPSPRSDSPDSDYGDAGEGPFLSGFHSQTSGANREVARKMKAAEKYAVNRAKRADQQHLSKKLNSSKKSDPLAALLATKAAAKKFMGLVKGGGSPKRRGKPIGPYDPVKFDAELDEAIATVSTTITRHNKFIPGGLAEDDLVLQEGAGEHDLDGEERQRRARRMWRYKYHRVIE